MEKGSYLTPEIQALLEQEVAWEATEPVDAGKIRRFAKSLGLENPAYYDLEKGRPAAPPTFIFSVNHDSLEDWDPGGRPTRRISLPPPFGPALRGGNQYEFFRQVQVGDWIRMKRKVTGLKEKQGRTGTLLFMDYQVDYTDQDRLLLGINRESLIFRVAREAPEGQKLGRRPDSGAPGDGPEIPSYQVTLSKLRLMMYAAATWNGNRVHWDSDFSRERGLPDAAVAGPMIADYLAEMLVQWLGDPSRLKSMELFNRNLAFPGDTLICRGQPGKNPDLIVCRLWAENQKGKILVHGTATASLP